MQDNHNILVDREHQQFATTLIVNMNFYGVASRSLALYANINNLEYENSLYQYSSNAMITRIVTSGELPNTW